MDWGLEDVRTGGNNSNLFFSSKAVSGSESENGHAAFSERASAEDAAMPTWERLLLHSSHWGWDGSGDTGLPRKGQRDFLNPLSLGCHEGGGRSEPCGCCLMQLLFPSSGAPGVQPPSRA